MTLIAKQIVKNQYWVVVDGSNKVGNVQAAEKGFYVNIGDKMSYFDTTNSIEQRVKIKFEQPKKTSRKETTFKSEWPAPQKIYNSVLDLKRKLHIFTKTKKSKCYYAAGYYVIMMNDKWELIFCPKYIFIQRYEYYGPYKTESEADAVLKTLL